MHQFPHLKKKKYYDFVRLLRINELVQMKHLDQFMAPKKYVIFGAGVVYSLRMGIFLVTSCVHIKHY